MRRLLGGERCEYFLDDRPPGSLMKLDAALRPGISWILRQAGDKRE